MKINDWLIYTKIDITGYKDIIDRIVIDNKIPVEAYDISTIGRDSKQYGLFSYADQFKEIQDAVINQVLLNTLPNKQFRIASAWTVYGEENSYHSIHNHNTPDTQAVATVLYLDVPKQPTVNQPGAFYYVYQDEHGVNQTGHILPEKGTLIVMPVHLYHGAYPQAKGTRQTLNMDFEYYEI